MAKYMYPAIFDPNEHDGFTITFPDLPGIVTEGDDMEESLAMAAEAMALHLYSMEKDGDEIPQPTKPTDVVMPDDADPDAFVQIITARTEPVHESQANRAVKKTLSIPQWLNEAAEAAGVNFSQELQLALKEKLGYIEKRS